MTINFAISGISMLKVLKSLRVVGRIDGVE